MLQRSVLKELQSGIQQTFQKLLKAILALVWKDLVECKGDR